MNTPHRISEQEAQDIVYAIYSSSDVKKSPADLANQLDSAQEEAIQAYRKNIERDIAETEHNIRYNTSPIIPIPRKLRSFLRKWAPDMVLDIMLGENLADWNMQLSELRDELRKAHDPAEIESLLDAGVKVRRPSSSIVFEFEKDADGQNREKILSAFEMLIGQKFSSGMFLENGARLMGLEAKHWKILQNVVSDSSSRSPDVTGVQEMIQGCVKRIKSDSFNFTNNRLAAELAAGNFVQEWALEEGLIRRATLTDEERGILESAIPRGEGSVFKAVEGIILNREKKQRLRSNGSDGREEPGEGGMLEVNI